MWLISALLILCFIIFTSFVIFVICRFGIPGSLSMTAYNFERQYHGAKFIFPLFVLLMCTILFPAWIYISVHLPFGEYNLSWVVGIVLLLLLVVCLTPQYYRSIKTKILHYSAATISLTAGALWIFINCYQLLFADMAIFALFFLLGFITRTLKRSRIFWLELAVVYCVVINLLVTSLTSIQ